MTDEQFGMLAAAILQLDRGFIEVVRHIVEQEAEIGAIRSILERKGVALSGELDRACDEAVRRLQEELPAIPTRGCQPVSRRRSGGGSRATG